MSKIISSYKKKNARGGKLTVDQHIELAILVVSKIKNTDNKFIKGFNNAFASGGNEGIKKWYKSVGSKLAEPSIRWLRRASKIKVKGITKISSKSIKLVKKIPGVKYVIPFVVYHLTYNNARAKGHDRIKSTSLAIESALSPLLVSVDDIDDARAALEAKYEGYLRGARAIGEGAHPNREKLLPIWRNLNDRNKLLKELTK